MENTNFVRRAGKIAVLFFCSAVIGLTPLSALAAGPAAADPGQMGIAQYKVRRYQEAKANLRKGMQLRPRDSTLYYYYALCQQQLGDVSGARKTYLDVIKYFPGSEAATLSGGAIGVLDRTGATNSAPAPEAPPEAQPAPSSARPQVPQRTNAVSSAPAGHAVFSGGGTVSGPDECNIPFEKVNDSIILNAMVNNRPIKVVFDTGAEQCAFGKNHLKDMGLRPPTGAPTGQAGGVGAGGVQNTWDIPATVTVGPITRNNFAISVQEEMPTSPLLGQTFFQDFTYTIDNGAHNIHVRKKNKVGGSIYQQKNDPYAVPFTRMGNEIIVQAIVNGNACPVIFDTGASVCLFPKAQIGKLGITIPEDAQVGKTVGIAGESDSSIFPIKSLKLGPIEKRDFEIHVSSDKLPAPLLGQTFYGDWQFTIDYENKIIHFVRR